MNTRPIVLSIAGFDPSSGAGVTADTKTAAAFDCFAVTCITALTIQSTQGVFGVEAVLPEAVRETLFRLAEDVKIAAVRIGMLGSGGVAGVVADFLEYHRPPNIVLDPVLRASSGAQLIDLKGVDLIRERLLRLSDVVTPNLAEAVELAGSTDGGGPALTSVADAEPRSRELAEKLHQFGCRSLVITGSDLLQPSDYLSWLDSDGIRAQVFPAERVDSKATHGTGCAFAMALACGLAHGRSLPDAVRQAQDFVRRAISAAYPVGQGNGPMNHLFRLD